LALKTSKVYRCLEKKTLVFGFEIVDLFLVFSILAVLNLLFGSMPYKFFFTWLPSISLAAFLRISKAGKPDNYLVHFARYHFSPGIFSAFPLATQRMKFVTRTKGAK
jgi:hypothetical protein